MNRARIDRRDELATEIERVCTTSIRYDEDDWTRIADLVLPMIDAALDRAAQEVERHACDGSGDSCEDVKAGGTCPYAHAAQIVRGSLR